MANKITDKNYTHECPKCKYKLKLKASDSTKKVCPGCKREVTFKKSK